MSKPRYYVETWDTDKQDFTPQSGVRTGPYSLWGLRKAIRKLRGMGYPCDYHPERDEKGKVQDHVGDPSVQIVRAEAAQKSLFE